MAPFHMERATDVLRLRVPGHGRIPAPPGRTGATPTTGLKRERASRPDAGARLRDDRERVEVHPWPPGVPRTTILTVWVPLVSSRSRTRPTGTAIAAVLVDRAA